MPKRVTRLHAVVPMVLAALACGADDDHDGGAVLALGAELEGVYELTERDLNLNGCEPIGATVLGHPYLALYTSEEPYASVNVVSCLSPTACQLTVRSIRAFRSVSFNFHISFYEKDDEATLTGFETKTLRSGNSCQMTVTDAVLERTEDGQIEVVAQYWHGDEFPADADGLCNEREGIEPALDQPCNELESMTAERVADLTED